jgi:hypothetical protein
MEGESGLCYFDDTMRHCLSKANIFIYILFLLQTVVFLKNEFSQCSSLAPTGTRNIKSRVLETSPSHYSLLISFKT